MRNSGGGSFENLESKKLKIVNGKPFSGYETDENGIENYYENGKIYEKNFYFDDKLVTETGTFDENGKLLSGEVKYFTFNDERDDFVVDKIVNVVENSEKEKKEETIDEKIERFIKESKTKAKVEEIIAENKEEEKIDVSEKEEEIIYISDEDLKIIEKLTDMEKSAILNEIHIEVTNFIKNKENKRKPFAKDLRYFYNEIKTEPEKFLKFYPKGKNLLEKVGLNKDFLKDFREKTEKLSYAEYVKNLEAEMAYLSGQIYGNIAKNINFILQDFENVKNSNFRNKFSFEHVDMIYIHLIIQSEALYHAYEKMSKGDFGDFGHNFRKSLNIIKNILNNHFLEKSLSRLNNLNYSLEREFNEKMTEYANLTIQH